MTADPIITAVLALGDAPRDGESWHAEAAALAESLAPVLAAARAVVASRYAPSTPENDERLVGDLRRALAAADADR